MQPKSVVGFSIKLHECPMEEELDSKLLARKRTIEARSVAGFSIELHECPMLETQ